MVHSGITNSAARTRSRLMNVRMDDWPLVAKVITFCDCWLTVPRNRLSMAKKLSMATVAITNPAAAPDLTPACRVVDRRVPRAPIAARTTKPPRYTTTTLIRFHGPPALSSKAAGNTTLARTLTAATSAAKGSPA